MPLGVPLTTPKPKSGSPTTPTPPTPPTVPKPTWPSIPYTVSKDGNTIITGTGTGTPLSASNPGPAKFYPPGTKAPSPGPITTSPIPAEMLANIPGYAYNADQAKTFHLWDQYMKAMEAQIDGRANDANAMLGFDRAFAEIANGYDTKKLNLDYGADMARMGQARYRDVDLARLAAQNAYNAGQRNFNTTTKFTNNAYGIDIARLAQQLAAGQGAYTLGMDQARAAFDTSNRQATDSAAASGAATSTGFGQTLNDIDATRSFTETGLRNAYDNLQRNNELDVSATTMSRDRTLEQAGNDWATTQADVARQNKYIDSVAKDYGVTSGQMQQAFKLGAQRLGLDYAQVLRKLSAAEASNSSQAQAAKDALAKQLLIAAQGG